MIKIDNVHVYGLGTATKIIQKSSEIAEKNNNYQDYMISDQLSDNHKIYPIELMKKYLHMLYVISDITAPLYWWKEFDTYKVGTVTNSCSTMHKIHAKEFTLDDFSHEHLMDGGNYILNSTIDMLNDYRTQYLKTKDKKYWWQMIQLLPTSYNQKRTVQLNYQVLKNIYHARKEHKLDEWRYFCEWIETLPYSELITD